MCWVGTFLREIQVPLPGAVGQAEILKGQESEAFAINYFPLEFLKLNVWGGGGLANKTIYNSVITSSAHCMIVST